MLSIVAVVINNIEITKRFVSSIRQYTTGEYELILIDNSSSDTNAIEYIKKAADNNFRFEERTDLAKAWNKGIELSKGDYVAVVNNDTVVPIDWFETLKETLDKNKKAGMVSPMTFWIIRDCHFKGECYPNFDKTFSTPFKLEKFKMVMWGEFCLFKRKALVDVGGYCDIYKRFGAEDLEMSFQLFSKGYDIYIDPRVFVYHEGSATGRLLEKDKRDKINKENFELFKSRWPEYAGDWK